MTLSPYSADMSTRFVPCDECDGMGEWDEGPINTGGPAPVDPIYRQVKCAKCDGQGVFECETEPLQLADLDDEH